DQLVPVRAAANQTPSVATHTRTKPLYVVIKLASLLTRMGHALPAGAAFEDRAERGSADRASLRTLFSSGLARDTAGLWIAFFFSLGSVYLIFGWLPVMLTSQGLNVATASTGLAVYNFGGVLGVLLWAMLV